MTAIASLGHRDVLGSLMSPASTDVSATSSCRMPERYCWRKLRWSLIYSRIFTKIAMVPVAIEEISLSDIAPRQEKVKEIKTTVASLRLDAIVSSGFGISRTKAADAIKGERVQVNWQPAKGPSQEVRQGDVISLRGSVMDGAGRNYRNVAKRSNRCC